MKKLPLISVIALFFFINTGLIGQDQIVKKDQSVIQCMVKEIGMDEIKYTLPDYSADLIFSIGKDQIIKIIFADGKEMSFKDEMTDPENYIENRKNAIKVDFISPLTGNTTFSYERSIKPGGSWESTLGIIGLGAESEYNNVFGLFMRFGYKFIKSPDFYLRGMRYAHILKGSYIKPEMSFGSYSYDDRIYDYSGYYPYTSRVERKSNTFASLMLNFGKQWVYDNSFLVDMYGGIGYGFSGDDYGGYNYAMVNTGGIPLAFCAGLKIGFLFK